MTKARRVLAVTAGLSATGAVVGAVIGGFTLLALILVNEGPGMLRYALAPLAFGAGVGAAIGLVFAPVASVRLLSDESSPP